METSKAIRLIKNYLKAYSLWSNMHQIGLDIRNYDVEYTELGCIIFDYQEDSEDIDEIGDIFSINADKMLRKPIDFHRDFNDELLTSTAINIYSDWKALKHRTEIKA